MQSLLELFHSNFPLSTEVDFSVFMYSLSDTADEKQTKLLKKLLEKPSSPKPWFEYISHLQNLDSKGQSRSKKAQLIKLLNRGLEVIDNVKHKGDKYYERLQKVAILSLTRRIMSCILTRCILLQAYLKCTTSGASAPQRKSLRIASSEEDATVEIRPNNTTAGRISGGSNSSSSSSESDDDVTEGNVVMRNETSEKSAKCAGGGTTTGTITLFVNGH